MTGIAAAFLALAFLLPHIPPQSIHLYLILGGLVVGYFVVIHATCSAHRLPKELAVGSALRRPLSFRLSPRRPDLRLLLIPPAILFAILCSLNCLFIYAWEHAEAQSIHPPYSTTQFALRHLTQLAVVNIATGAALALFDRHCPWPIFAAIVISTVLLLLLHTLSRHHFPPSLRASADLTLLTPVLLIPFL